MSAGIRERLRRFASVVGHFLSVRPGEWGKLSLVLLLQFVLGMSMAILDPTTEALFLGHLDLSNLSLMFLISGGLRILVSLLYATFADRIPADKLLIHFLVAISATFLILTIFIPEISRVIPLTEQVSPRETAGQLFENQDYLKFGTSWQSVIPIAYFLFLNALSYVTLMIINTHLPVYLTGLYNILEYKRLVSLIASIEITGSILAAFLLWQNILDAKELMFLSIGLCGIGIVVVYWIQHLYPHALADHESDITRRHQVQKQKAPTLENIRQIVVFTKSSTFMQYTLGTTLVMVILLQLLRYEYSGVFQAEKVDTANLIAFFGGFKLVAGLISLFIPLVIGRQLIDRLGVGLANLAYPIVTTVAAASLVFTNMSYGSAIVARFVRESLKKSLKKPTTELLYNCVPRRIRGRARAFAVGFISPVGTILAGFLIMFFDYNREFFGISGVLKLLGVISTLLGLIYIYLSYKQKDAYVQSVIKLLREKDVDLTALAAKDFGRIDAETLRPMFQQLRNTDDEIAVHAARILGRVGKGHPEVFDTFVEVFPNVSVPVQAGILEAMGDLEDKRAKPIVLENLGHRAPQIQRAAAETLTRPWIASVDEIAAALQPLITDDDAQVRSIAATALVRTHVPKYAEAGFDILTELFFSPLAKERLVAVVAYRNLNDPRYIILLSKLMLEDDDKEVRYQAALAVENLAAVHSVVATQSMLKALEAKDDRIRQCAARTLGRTNRPEAIKPLIARLDDPYHRVRKAAIIALHQIGKPATNALLEVAFNPHATFRMRENALRALRDVKSSSRKVRVLEFIEQTLKQCYQYRSAIDILTATPAVNHATTLLRKVLLERCNEFQTLMLLSLGVLDNKKHQLDIIDQKLKSTNERIRATAVEALDSVEPKIIKRLFVPLLDGTRIQDCREIAVHQWGISFPSSYEDVIRECLESSDTWIQACAIYAVGELKAEVFFPWIQNAQTTEDRFVQEAAEEARNKLS